MNAPIDLSKIALRPEVRQDEPFNFELYASTRKEEVDAWGWPAEMQSAFLQMQFKAYQGHRAAFPNADFQIVHRQPVRLTVSTGSSIGAYALVARP